MVKYVAYYRVSTERQGRSGLGLEAQEAAVAAFLAGQDARVVASFTEVESGRKNSRPQLAEAMKTARAYGAALLVAKIDRLARDAAFLLSLKDAGIEVRAADMPDADRTMFGIMAIIAEREAEAISARTKAALVARKARGHQLGNVASLRPGDAGSAAQAAAAAAEKARRDAERVRPIIERLKGEGLSLRAVARQLQADGVPSARGGAWTATSVSNVLKGARGDRL